MQAAAKMPGSKRFLRDLARRAHRAFGAVPQSLPSFVSRTLEAEDADLARRWLARRPAWTDPTPVRDYEEHFARWNGSQHAFAFGSGRVALSAAIEALGLRPGDEVVVPAFTCVAVPNAFRFAGVEVRWADIELETFGLSAEAFEDALGPRTRAVLVQHLFGLVARDTRDVLDLAHRRGVRVIEDCAHSTGARLGNRRVGTLGDIGFTSSEHSKVYSTVRGGMTVTDDAELARQLRKVRERAPQPTHDEVEALLWNVVYDYHRHAAPELPESARIVAELAPRALPSLAPGEAEGRRPERYGLSLAAPLAALGAQQLAKVERFNARRRHEARRWNDWCVRAGYAVPLVVEGSTPVFLRYPLLVEPERKADLRWAERELGVRPGVWFITPTHPADLGVRGFANAEQAVAGLINLPTLA